MQNPKLIVWGGFWDQHDGSLSLDELNSHASVTCYFLGQALATHFDVVQISSFLDAERILDHPDASAALSTFQAGFSRLGRERPDVLAAIRREFSGQLCSIVDLLSFDSYAEDILFTVIPPRATLKERLKRLRSAADVRHMGWCADPGQCHPRNKDDVFTIFLDHGHYAEDDHTHVFIDALNILHQDKKTPPMRVFVQGNQGIEEWPLGTPWHGERYRRAAKVPWTKIQEYYGRSDLFCVTHRESAGLGVIEAAMSGATIIIPKSPHPFISSGLVETGFARIIADCNSNDIAASIRASMDEGVDRSANHAQVSKTHNWQVAAANIANALKEPAPSA